MCAELWLCSPPGTTSAASPLQGHVCVFTGRRRRGEAWRGVCFYSLHREQGVPCSRSVVPRRSVFSLQGPEVLLSGFLHLQGDRSAHQLCLMSFFLQTISLLLRKEMTHRAFTRQSQTWFQVFMNVMLSFLNLLSLRCI